MKEYQLKYGCNPNQKPARIYMEDGSALPVEILNGRPGYINFLDALNGWQLVKELKEATALPAAASFKHVSPAGAAVAVRLSDNLKKACFVDDVPGVDDSPLACAFARARGADRMCSFGDWISLSDECDEVTAMLIAREVSDGIIAPGYTPKALEILKKKRKGAYNIVRIDGDYTPAPVETKQVYGVTFEQGRNNYKIDKTVLENIVTQSKLLPDAAARDLVTALIISSRVFTVRVLPAEKRTHGGLDSTKRCLIFPSARTLNAPTATMRSTGISIKTKKTSVPTVCGRNISYRAPNRLPIKKRAIIWTE